MNMNSYSAADSTSISTSTTSKSPSHSVSERGSGRGRGRGGLSSSPLSSSPHNGLSSRNPHASSPRRNHTSKSRSPTRRGAKSNSRSPNRPRQHAHTPKEPSKMTVIANRVDLWDAAAHFFPEETNQDMFPKPTPNLKIAPYQFESTGPFLSNELPPGERNPYHPHQRNPHRHHYQGSPDNAPLVVVTHVAHHFHYDPDHTTKMEQGSMCQVVDTSTPNPYDPSDVHDKYWAQRRRLFSRFDSGIQLDNQGWYSVTPEIIADHVADRIAQLASTCPGGITLLDAFCGCGGNSIAFGKIPSNLIKQVVCLDTDRSKLIKAAHNAAIYDIPREKLVFVECNSIFVMRYVYKDGTFVLDQPHAALPPYMPPPVAPATHSGYQVGGLDLLPRHIDAVFMDPPWGGVDYEVLGKTGYDLERNMKIRVSPDRPVVEKPVVEETNNVADDFFDNFTDSSRKKSQTMSDQARKASFNSRDDDDDGEYINGVDLIKIAAEATRSRVVIYDLPRNTNKISLGKAALKAGYQGNMKLEEHYLNGRLKTATAYMGADFTFLLDPANAPK